MWISLRAERWFDRNSRSSREGESFIIISTNILFLHRIFINIHIFGQYFEMHPKYFLKC